METTRTQILVWFQSPKQWGQTTTASHYCPDGSIAAPYLVLFLCARVFTCVKTQQRPLDNTFGVGVREWLQTRYVTLIFCTRGTSDRAVGERG